MKVVSSGNFIKKGSVGKVYKERKDSALKKSFKTNISSDPQGFTLGNKVVKRIHRAKANFFDLINRANGKLVWKRLNTTRT